MLGWMGEKWGGLNGLKRGEMDLMDGVKGWDLDGIKRDKGVEVIDLMH